MNKVKFTATGGTMLTFEEKLAVIESFTQLKRNDVSLKRVNFQFEKSVQDRKMLFTIYIQTVMALYMARI